MARHYSAISMNAALFARIDDLYQRRAGLGLDAETLRVLERHGRVLSARAPSSTRKARRGSRPSMRSLPSLGANFGQNVLADEKDWVLFLEEGDIAGLPEFLKTQWRRRRRRAARKVAYAVTLSRSIYEPFTTFSDAATCAKRRSGLHRPRREWRRHRQRAGGGRDAVRCAPKKPGCSATPATQR